MEHIISDWVIDEIRDDEANGAYVVKRNYFNNVNGWVMWWNENLYRCKSSTNRKPVSY